MVGRSDERLLEVAAREDRHVLIQHVAEVIHPARADLRKRGGPLGVVDQSEIADLGFGVDAHSEDQGSRKLGNSVSPPSTKIV